MYCLSLDYKSTSGEIRSYLSLTSSEIISLSKRIEGGIVAVFTCNRIELYFEDNPKKVLDAYKSLRSISPSVEKLFVCFKEQEAFRHLFEVVSGLCSMLVGEDDIARQIKKAYAFSHNNSMSSKEINLLFQKAFNCAKRVKSETVISKSATSFATLAQKESKNFIVQNALGGTVLLIGITGELGSVIARNILSDGYTLIATNRHCKGNVKTDIPCTIVDYEKRYEYIKKADVIITATSSPHTIFYADRAKEFINGKKLFIDLSVPFDVDRKIADFARLIDIDYFSNLAKKHTEEKQQAIAEAFSIIDEELYEFCSTLQDYKMRDKNAILSDAL